MSAISAIMSSMPTMGSPDIFGRKFLLRQQSEFTFSILLDLLTFFLALIVIDVASPEAPWFSDCEKAHIDLFFFNILMCVLSI